MSNNNRLFYACQVVAIGEHGQSSWGTGTMVHGAQSVGMTTNFNLEQMFELGQVEIYENIEGIPDVEVTLEKALDGYALIYHMATTGVEGAASSGLIARSKQRCYLRLGIFNEEYDNVGSSPEGAEVEIYCSGMYLSSVSYNIPADSSATESVTLVGNNKQWIVGELNVKLDEVAVNNIDGVDEPLAYTTGSGGIQRREDFMMANCILPIGIRGVNGSGVGNGWNAASLTPRVHLNSVSISTDFGREPVLELGRKTPYYRPATYPIEVSCEIEAITVSGDFVSALENGDPALHATVASGDNTSNEIIYLETRCGYAWDLGNKNRLSSVNYGGGDTGGGNVSCTYSYSNFNVLDIQHSGSLLLTPRGYLAVG